MFVFSKQSRKLENKNDRHNTLKFRTNAETQRHKERKTFFSLFNLGFICIKPAHAHELMISMSITKSVFILSTVNTEFPIINLIKVCGLVFILEG